jgi:tetratricopeptide (TPR) repeat protein
MSKNAKSKSTNPAEDQQATASATGGYDGVSGKYAGRFFRKVDWQTAAFTALFVFVGYLFSIAPDVTLEDSGELSVGSFYAGVPHPPGYPVWTLYTWLFTVLVPISNIAFRVALSSAVAAAAACGLLSLMVSRGSSMIVEGMEELKGMDRSLEDWICRVSGWVAGMLLGFNGFMWSQAVIVEVYTLSVLSLMGVLVCLMHWVYVPERKKYLYWAFFLFGICFNNHQTLIVAAMGLEVAIAAVNIRLGRDLFLFNSVIYLLGLIAKWNGMLTAFDQNIPLFVIYNAVGIASIGVFVWAWNRTQEVLTEWVPLVIIAAVFLLGASFYFYMPIASSTNPPMNWAYPRTWDGFVHAFSRGQYERANPTSSPLRFIQQMYLYFKGAGSEFSPVMLLIGLVPFFCWKRMAKRERAWMTGLMAVFFCLAVILMILLNPPPDKQSQDLNRVFFTSSHVLIAIFMGYGVALIASFLARQYEAQRLPALTGGAIAVALAIYGKLGLERVHPLDQFTAFYGILLSVAFILIFGLSRSKAPMKAILLIFALAPFYSVMSHWWENEQRGHLFGYWFGHDMFSPPLEVYPEMAEDAILFGGTDPGRFNPTYMIFCESFIPASKKPRDPDFDRRDVRIITQNALADGTYLDYIRAHYFRSAQRDLPFFQEMLRSSKEKELNQSTNWVARAFAPLDNAMTSFGAYVEQKRKNRGVYPAKEIYTPSHEDSEKAYLDYMADAAQRKMSGHLKPGEIVTETPDGRISVQGQAAVMAINAILAKIIFDKNPGHEFYIEESMPLEWMYPHLTPFGIIMKINREEVPVITEEMLKKDHQFWSQYMNRLVGDWVKYDTPIEDIVKFADDVYLKGDLSAFKGDTKFVRDDWAQKAFSKLRSGIAGIYAWRLGPQCPKHLQPKTVEEEQRLLEEADYAFRQALVLCPYSPEAVFRYSNLLAMTQRVDDAIMITEKCFEFDYENEGVRQLLQQLHRMKQGQAKLNQIQDTIHNLEQQFVASKTNLDVAYKLMSNYVLTMRTNEAIVVMDELLADPNAPAETILTVASAYNDLKQYDRLENALIRLVEVIPDNPEAWFDLAGTQALMGKHQLALQTLSKTMELSRARKLKNPEAVDLARKARADTRFNAMKVLPEFQKILNGTPLNGE